MHHAPVASPRDRSESGVRVPNTEAASLKEYGRRRAWRDLYARSLVGIPFYLAGCLVLIWTGDLLTRSPSEAIIVVSVFAILLLARRWHRAPLGALEPALARWEKRHWALIHIGSLAWGLIVVRLGLVEAAPTPPVLIAIICSVAYGAATSPTYAMKPRMALTSVALLFLPAIVVLSLAVPSLRPFMLTLAIFGIYVLLSLKRYTAEYGHQLEIEYALIESRREIEQLSLTDALTGLGNRRRLDLAWHQAWHEARRQRTPLALLMIDLDHFKQINDTHGHQAGDHCLAHVASLLRDHFRRETDLIARFGGEEFVVVIHAPASQALPSAHRFLTLLRETPVIWNGEAIRLTASIGVAEVDFDFDVTPDVTLYRADQATYAVKHAGRDAVRLASSEDDRLPEQV